MQQNYMDTSDTNFIEMKNQFADATNANIETMDKVYAEHFERAKKDAIALADQRSRNAQKFGELVKQAGSFKQQLDEFNANREYDKSKRSEEGDQTKTKGRETVAKILDPTFGQTTTVKPAQEETKALEIKQEATNSDIQGEIVTSQSTSAAVQTASTENNERAIEDLTLQNTPSYDQFQVKSQYEAQNIVDNVLPKLYTTEFPAGVFEGADGKTFIDVYKTNPALAQKMADWWAKSLFTTLGVRQKLKGKTLRQFYKNTDNRHRAIANTLSSRLLEEKIAETQTIKVEQIEAVLNSGDQEVISEFFFGDPKIKNSGFLTKLAYSDGTGKKNMDHAFRELGKLIELGAKNNMLDHKDLNTLRNTPFKLNGGGTVTLETMNTTGSRTLVKQLLATERKMKTEYIKGKQAEKVSATFDAIEGVKTDMKKMSEDGEYITPEWIDKQIETISGETGTAITDPIFTELKNLRISSDRSDYDLRDAILRDVEDGVNDGSDVYVLISQIQKKNIRDDTKTKVDEALAKGIPTKEQKASKDNQIKELLREAFSVQGMNTKVGYDDAETNANKLYTRKFQEAIKRKESKDEAHEYALNEVRKVFAQGKPDDGSGRTTYFNATKKFDDDPSKTSTDGIKKVGKMFSNGDVNALMNSDQYLPGEDSASQAAMNYEKTGEIPAYYVGLSKFFKNKNAFEVMRERMTALGLNNNADGKIITYESDIPEKSLNIFSQNLLYQNTPSSTAQALINEFNFGDAKAFNDIYAKGDYDDITTIDGLQLPSIITGTEGGNFFKRGTPIAKKFSEMTIDEVDAVYSGKSSYIGTDYEGMPLFNTVPVQYNRTGRFVDREVKLGKYQLSYKDFTHLRETLNLPKDLVMTPKVQDYMMHHLIKERASILNLYNSTEGEHTSLLKLDFDTFEVNEEIFKESQFTGFNSPNVMPTGLIKYISAIDTDDD